jgi:phosphoribosyl-ATP pyrophosphohydrolase
LALKGISVEKNQQVRPSHRAMSKKRKRHQDPEELVALTDENSIPLEKDPLEPEDSSSVKKLTEQDAVNVQKKIFHAVKETGRAFKKARDFELRKIIKRIKTAKLLSYVTILTDRDANEVEKLGRLEKELPIAKVVTLSLSC